MARQPRLIPPQGFLHVICRGNNRRKLFFHPRDFRIYERELIKLKHQEQIKILHYCLMPNHIHLLVGVRETSDLSRFMKRLNLKYFFYYRKKHIYTGHLWQDRFKSKIIEEESYLIQCGKYIELNPVRAGIVHSPEEYIYSSYLHYIRGTKDDIVDSSPLYSDLGNTVEKRQAAYRNIMIKEAEMKNKLVEL